MARFIAIAEKPGLTETAFREALNRTKKWRYDKRGWVIRAHCSLGSGKLVIESEATNQALFESWLKSKGWAAKEIHQINLLHEAGTIWPLGK